MHKELNGFHVNNNYFLIFFHIFISTILPSKVLATGEGRGWRFHHSKCSEMPLTSAAFPSGSPHVTLPSEIPSFVPFFFLNPLCLLIQKKKFLRTAKWGCCYFLNNVQWFFCFFFQIRALLPYESKHERDGSVLAVNFVLIHWVCFLSGFVNFGHLLLSCEDHILPSQGRKDAIHLTTLCVRPTIYKTNGSESNWSQRAHISAIFLTVFLQTSSH